MRYLCLPGAFGSAKNFQVQLGPFCKELSSDGKTSFFFTQGEIECKPPPGFLDYFGPAPHYRFFEYDGIEKNDVLERIRDFPEGETPEEVLRELAPPQGAEGLQQSVQNALDAVYRTMDKHGPFDGLCAYSEGTVVASTLILEEQRRFLEEGIPRRIKAAVFFAGWPPLDVRHCSIVLADEYEEFIQIPTCHVVGAGDPYLKGAVALYNICDEDSAILFDHGKGHTLPRDAKTLRELADTIRRMRYQGYSRHP
ncbi:hypothetical protein OIDMADRAFT_41494 [Oidiodendron maius Zn]|uniref:Serine hydrolase domain-containing protein n=1 Tax=Oidiodendron maius (strain Zn) TaxID=913774 RepID=A0A0C3HGZ5_OIDMZ|nr:hypothetical protein OIDMADRAFT_41494 [Oidiodendron maius Zn]